MQPRTRRRRGYGAAALPGGDAHPGETAGAIVAAAPVTRVVRQSALSAPPSPIHDRQNISGFLPRLSAENRSGLRSLSRVGTRYVEPNRAGQPDAASTSEPARRAESDNNGNAQEGCYLGCDLGHACVLAMSVIVSWCPGSFSVIGQFSDTSGCKRGLPVGAELMSNRDLEFCQKRLMQIAEDAISTGDRRSEVRTLKG